MKNILCLTIISALLFSAACKKTNPTPGFVPDGQYTIGGDSTFNVRLHSDYNNSGISVGYLEFGAVNSAGIDLSSYIYMTISPACPVAPHVYAIGHTDSIFNANLVLTWHGGTYRNDLSSQMITVANGTGGKALSMVIPTIWLHGFNNTAYTDSVQFSGNFNYSNY